MGRWWLRSKNDEGNPCRNAVKVAAMDILLDMVPEEAASLLRRRVKAWQQKDPRGRVARLLTTDNEAWPLCQVRFSHPERFRLERRGGIWAWALDGRLVPSEGETILRIRLTWSYFIKALVAFFLVPVGGLWLAALLGRSRALLLAALLLSLAYLGVVLVTRRTHRARERGTLVSLIEGVYEGHIVRKTEC